MSECTRIDLLRHGECEGGHIFRGHNDVALTAAGRAQMQAAIAKVAGRWHQVISSPLQRCRSFALQLSPVRFDERLREMSFGSWDGRLIDEIWRDDEMLMSAWSRDPSAVTPPGGEPLATVAARVMACFAELLAQHRGQQILLVSHGGVIRVMLSQLLGMPLSHAGRIHVPYAALTSVAVYHHAHGDSIKLLGHNWSGGDADYG